MKLRIPIVSRGRWKALLTGLRPRPARHLHGADLGVHALALAAAALTVWMAFEVTSPVEGPAYGSVRDEPSANVQRPGAGRADDLNSYLTPITSRRVFRAPERQQRKTTSAPESPRVLAKLAADLVLTGIIGGETPKAIITNTKTGETYYVAEGQSIGESRVKTIGTRSVVLEVGEEEIILGL